MAEEAELFLFQPPDPGSDYRAQAERIRTESRRRYVDHLTFVLAEIDDDVGLGGRAETIIDGLTSWRHVDGGEPCQCSCHPHLPASDLHDYGFACSCRLTSAERSARWKEWLAERDGFWASEEGQRITAAEQAEEAELDAWLADHAEVVVRSHGGLAPEQWWGEVDGRSFYFRERHEEWRIELDLRPSGRFVKAWVSGSLDDGVFEQRELDEGNIIAEGTTGVDGYGETPVERVRFIVDAIRTHLQRAGCEVHTTERDDLELLFGRPLAWCPACGSRLTYRD